VSSYLDTIENEIRQRRAQAGISQKQLGEAVGVSRQTINAIETGKYMPSLPLAFALARHFDAVIEDLFKPEKGDAR
jgi:putative transcriptional regulator